METPDGKRVHLAPAFSDFQVRGDNGAYQMGPPPGLLLDSFAGSIAGVPRAAGVCPVTIRLEDYDEQAPPVDVVFAVRIEDTPLEIVDVRRTAAMVDVSYRTITNHLYRLESSADLVTWSTVVSGVAGTGGVVTSSDPNGGAAARRFYRVLEF